MARPGSPDETRGRRTSSRTPGGARPTLWWSPALGAASLLVSLCTPALAQDAPAPQALTASPRGAVPAGSAPGGPAGPCTNVDLAGDEMNCSDDLCSLRGNVSLTCESMRLFARELDVHFTKDGEFAGAVARGQAVLVDGARVITCDAIALGADRVQARLDHAAVHVKRLPLKLSPSGVPVGRDQSVFTGARVERLTRDRLHIEDATFTLCDCGTEPPSWHLSARSMDATLGKRVTVYWPVFWIRPFGLQVPLTPPLPPLSVPLESRAAGFLAPRIALYAPPWPTVDLPFFIPLGPSWDLTLAPGLRTDFTRTHGLAPDEWGAPRLGARLRYAPESGTLGEWALDWTHDGEHYAPVLHARGITDPSCLEHPGLCPDWGIVERVAVTASHRTDFSDQLRLLARVEWVSDDLYRNDFAIGLDQVAAYLPSRVGLAWRSPLLAGGLGAAYLERIGLTETPWNPTTRVDPSNLAPAEYQAPQHGPSARLRVVPLDLGGGLLAEGELGFDRFGAFARAPAAVAPALYVTRATPALAYARALGPVSVRARASLDAAVLSGEGGLAEPTEALAALADADASLSLGRRFGDWLHLVTPRLSYRAIPWRSGPALAGVPYRAAGTTSIIDLDETLRRDAVEHQAMLSVGQDLYHVAGGAVVRVARLEVAQPLDLRSRSLLPARVTATVAPAGGGSASVEADVYLPGIDATPRVTTVGDATIDENRVLRDVVASVSSPALGPVTFGVAYNRFSPESSRLLRTMYELEAPLGRIAPGAAWIHYLSFGAALRLPPRLALTYGTDYYLRYPGEAPNDNLPGFTEHRVGLDYHSPCDCWDVRFLFRVPREPQGGSRFKMAFFVSVAGFGVGG